MPGEGQVIHGQGFEIKGNLPHGLDGVGVEKDAPGFGQLCGFTNGEDNAGFVVGIHHGNQSGIVIQGGFVSFQVEAAFFIHIQPGHLIAALLEEPAHSNNGRVLNPGGDEMTLFRAALQGSQNSGGIRFGAAAGENDFFGGSPEKIGYAGTSVFHSPSGNGGKGIHAGRIAVLVLQERQHGLQHFRSDHSRCVVIKIGQVHAFSPGARCSGRTTMPGSTWSRKVC